MTDFNKKILDLYETCTQGIKSGFLTLKEKSQEEFYVSRFKFKSALYGIAAFSSIICFLVFACNSIYNKAFLNRVTQSVLKPSLYPPKCDIFSINKFLENPDLLAKIKGYFAIQYPKLGLDFYPGFSFDKGFMTYYDYFCHNLTPFQKVEFFDQIHNYFQSHPELINQYFGSQENFTKFSNYLSGEHAAAIDKGSMWFGLSCIIFAVVVLKLCLAMIYLEYKKASTSLSQDIYENGSLVPSNSININPIPLIITISKNWYSKIPNKQGNNIEMKQY
jgi:hypothetical protein